MMKVTKKELLATATRHGAEDLTKASTETLIAKGGETMKKKNNFYVIGGQYEYHCYGGAPTLIGAKRLATKHEEYWDNWQGWHKPAIYKAEDTELIEAYGCITVADGSTVRVPKEWAHPVY